MKCLHICNDFLGSRVYENLYSQLDLLGVEQYVFHPLRNEISLESKNDIAKKSGGEIYYSKLLKKNHKYFFRNKIKHLLADAVQIKDIAKINIIHATTLFSDGALALKLHKKYNIPYIVNVRVTDITIYLKYRPDLYFLALNILKNAHEIIFISETLKKRFFSNFFMKQFKKKYDYKSIAIPNGIHEFWLKNQRIQQKEKAFKVLYVGTFIKRKNVMGIVRAVIALNKNNFNIQFTIVGGKGEHEDEIKNAAKQYPEFLNYLGSIHDKDKLKEIYRQHHIFAMPSFNETFGLVYIEALSQGLPIICSENDGIDGTLSLKIGEFVNPKSMDSISDGLRNIMNNYTSYEVDKIDFTTFSWKLIAEKYNTIYKDTVTQ